MKLDEMNSFARIEMSFNFRRMLNSNNFCVPLLISFGARKFLRSFEEFHCGGVIIRGWGINFDRFPPRVGLRSCVRRCLYRYCKWLGLLFIRWFGERNNGDIRLSINYTHEYK